MTSNVLPLHFALSQASSSQNSNVDNFQPDCHNPFKILWTLDRQKNRLLKISSFIAVQSDNSATLSCLVVFKSMQNLVSSVQFYFDWWNITVVVHRLGILDKILPSSNIIFTFIDKSFQFVAFCSFFTCSLTVVHRGRQRKSGGRQ